jgi:predicted DNA-binding protein
MKFPEQWRQVVRELAEKHGITEAEALELSLEALRRMKEGEP